MLKAPLKLTLVLLRKQLPEKRGVICKVEFGTIDFENAPRSIYSIPSLEL